MEILFISIDWMPFLASTLDNADPLFARVITPGLHLHRKQVADQDPASGSVLADSILLIVMIEQQFSIARSGQL